MIFIETTRKSGINLDEVLEISVKGNEERKYSLYVVLKTANVSRDTYSKEGVRIYICESIRNFDDAVKARDILFERISNAMSSKQSQVFVPTSDIVELVEKMN